MPDLKDFTFDPTPKAEPKAETKSLEGFTFDPSGDEQPPPRTWTGHPAPTNVREGVQQIGRDIGKAGEIAADLYRRANEHAKGLLTGTIEPTPENVMPWVTATITPAQRGTAAAIASVPGWKGAGAAAQTAETALPKYAEGGLKGAAAEKLAGMPFVGNPVRAAAAKPLAEYEAQSTAAYERGLEHFGRAESAALRPTGAEPDLVKAGEILAQGAKDQRAFVTPRGTVLEWNEQLTKLPPKFEAMIKGRPENNPARVIAMAGAGEGKAANFKDLAELRKNINSTDWRQVESASFAELGKVPTQDATGVIRSVEFDPITALRNYEALPEPGRRILFGGPKAPFRVHLDSLVADTKSLDALSARLEARSAKLEPLRRIPQRATPEGIVETATMGASAFVHPLVALASVIGARATASIISRPQTAAALAQWSKAYLRFIQSGGAPAGIAALKIATNNLRNTADIDIDADKLVEAMQRPKSNAPQVQKFADENEKADWFRSIEEGPHNVGFTAKMSPKGMNTRHMRPSENIERRTGMSAEGQDFVLPNSQLRTAEERNMWARQYDPALVQWIRDNYNKEYRTRAPRGSLSNAAGLADLETQSGTTAEPGPLMRDLVPPQPPARNLPPVPRGRPKTDSTPGPKTPFWRSHQERQAKTGRQK